MIGKKLRARLAALLSAAMLLSAASPLSALAEEPVDYGISIQMDDSEVAVQSLDLEGLIPGCTVSTDPATNTTILTLTKSVGKNGETTTITGDGETNLVIQSNQNPAFNGNLTVKNVHNFTMTGGPGYTFVAGNANIGCTGDLVVRNTGSGSAFNKGLTANAEGNVTIEATGTVIDKDTATITTSGTVTIKNTGDQDTVKGPLCIDAGGDVQIAASGDVSEVINGSANIKTSGSVTIKSVQGSYVVKGDLTINAGGDVVAQNGNGKMRVVEGKAEITADGNVTMTNKNDGVVSGGLIVHNAKNVTLAGGGSSWPVINHGADIHCTEDLQITGEKYSLVRDKNSSLTSDPVYDGLKVTGAQNVTLTIENNCTNTCVIADNADIECSGKLQIKNKSNSNKYEDVIRKKAP